MLKLFGFQQLGGKFFRGYYIPMICHLVRTLLILSVMIGVAACRTTQPAATSIKSEIVMPTNPTDSIPPGSSVQVLQWVIVTKNATGADDGDITWNLDLKTAPEIWCERQCSKFELIEVVNDEMNQLQVVKTPIAGNTTPGMLSLSKDIRSDRGNAKKIRLLNVGVRGNSVVVEDVITKDHPNFYAVPMMISSRGEGLNRLIMGDFEGKSVLVRIVGSNSALPALKSSEPVLAFVMGAMVQEVGANGKPLDVLLATRIIAPWSEE